jgi:hypothetical protein
VAIASDTATQNGSCASASFDNSDPSVAAFVTRRSHRYPRQRVRVGVARDTVARTGEPKALTTSKGWSRSDATAIYRPGYRPTGAESELAHMQWSRASVGRVTSV